MFTGLSYRHLQNHSNIQEPNYQTFFIELLRKSVSPKINLADEIGQLLNISADSSYRRLRGETEFTLNEAIRLCNYFDIPLEILNANMSEAVTFRTNKLTSDKDSFTVYLEGLYKELSWLSKYESAEIIYAAEDLPVFYSLFFPVLARFKMCYWTKSILNVPELQRLKIEDVELPDTWHDVATRISELFLKLKSIEIWNTDTFKSTFEQIKFYWEAGFFREKQTAFDVIDEFGDVIRMIERQSEMGKKMNFKKGQFSQADYVLYTSELMIGNNCVLIRAEDKGACYIGYNSFNYMRTSNRFFNEQAESWMRNLISKSTLLSMVSEKQRNQFFKATINQIEALRKQIESE
jgi:hypothetical protein